MRCLQKEPVDRYADVGELATALAPFGPKNASTSASRIQIVLRRARDSSVVIANDVPLAMATIVPAPVVAKRPPSVVTHREPPGVESTTFGSTAGESMSTLRTARPSWGAAGAVILGLGLVAMLVVALWRTGAPELARSGSAVTAPGENPAGAEPTAAPPPNRPGPIVEPIEVAADPATPPGPPANPANPAVTAPMVNQVAPSPEAPSPPRAGEATTRPGKLGGAAPGPKPKKRRPRLRPGAGRPGAGTAPGGSEGSAGADSGSAEPPDDDDDDKWTHMTHDEKQP